MSAPRPQDILVTGWGARFMGRKFPCAIGKGGITGHKREGDGATPLGCHKIVGAIWRPDRLSQPMPWAEPILPGDLWSDDMAAPDYNHMVRAPYAPSHEALRRADPLYDLVLITDWNWPEAVAGAGSAIFIHRWRKPRHPTEGCVAFDPRDLLWIATQLAPDSQLIIRG